MSEFMNIDRFRCGLALVSVVWICTITTSAPAADLAQRATVPASASAPPPRWAYDLFDSPELRRGFRDGGQIVTASRSSLLGANVGWAAAAQAGTTQGVAGEDTGGADAQNLDAIGEAMANPLSYLWLMFMQNDTIWHEGNSLDRLDKDAKAQNVFMLNPVLSIQLTEEWKTIFRPVIPINSFNTVDNVGVSTGNPGGVTGIERERETGLGDIVLWTAFSNMYKPPFIFGFGPTLMLDTATDEQLGTGKNSAGPMVLAFYLSDKWILGTIAQHWWSFSGESNIDVETDLGRVSVDRPGINLTDVQPVIRYRLSPKTNIGIAPNWRYNWKTEQLDLPLGIGGDTLIQIGKLPVKIGVEAYYHVFRDDDFGPEWQLRFLFIPVLPSPDWSRRPLF